jgi:hypothetical protein
MSTQRPNPFELPGQWYKAALHTHAPGIDGGIDQEDLVELYRAKGFDLAVIAEHERTTDLSGLSSKDFLAINGIELHPLYPGHPVRNHHVVGLGVPHGYPTSRAAQKDLGACLAQFVKLGGVAVVGHPHGVDIDPTLVAGTDADAYEVFNAHQENMHGGDREALWAKGLDNGIMLTAIAVDDMHEKHELGAAWTMLKMKSLTVRAALNAIRTGACYGSNGPTIKDVRVTDDTVEVKCSPAASIVLAGPKGKCDVRDASKTGRVTTYAIAKPDWPFVRVIVTDHKGRKAWSNPIMLD